MADAPSAYPLAWPNPRLTHEPPPKELGARLSYADRMTLAIFADYYTREAIDRALDDIEASKKARTDG